MSQALLGNRTGSARTRVPVPEVLPEDRVESARTGDSMAEAVIGNPGGRDASTEARNVTTAIVPLHYVNSTFNLDLCLFVRFSIELQLL